MIALFLCRGRSVCRVMETRPKEFSEFIRANTIEEDEIMVSFDVEVLCTNVPIDDALAIIKELLDNDETLPDQTPLSSKNVLDVLDFLQHTTFFIFNGTYYQQTGVAMGEPPSSIVAEIYMQGTETTALTTTSHPPKVWERHVDKVFSIIQKSKPHNFFQYINLGGGGGGGERAYVVIQGCAIILGTFWGVAPGFLGIFFGLLPEFWVSFFVKFDFFQNNPDFGVLILIFPSMTLWNVTCRALVSMILQFSFLFH